MSNKDPANYHRPNQDWQCGHSLRGRACLRGPTLDGRCQADTLCMPKAVGETWRCTRRGALGGPCDKGPNNDGGCSQTQPPCVPIKSLRRVRGNWIKWVVVTGIALVFILLTSIPEPDKDHASQRVVGKEFISPGPLRSAHANAAQSCGDCHAAAHDGRFGWIRSAFQRVPAVSENRRCLACHSLGEYASQAHSLDPVSMIAAHKRAVVSGRAQLQEDTDVIPGLKRVYADDGQNIACALCHQDHRGDTRSLSDMDDETCQICHGTSFESFSNGHPGFSDHFPKRLRSRKTIRFDHRQKDHKAVPCLDCHRLDPSNATMLPADFYTPNSECASCHDDGKALGKETQLFNLAELEFNAEDPEDMWAQYLSLEDFDDAADQTRLVYHADGLLRRWIEVLLRPEEEEQCEIAEDILSNYIHAADSGINDEDGSTVGACLRCHTVDSDQIPSVDNCPPKVGFSWRVRRTHPSQQGFTRFSHGPHLVYVFEKEDIKQGCNRCHGLSKQENAQFDFEQISRDTCLACHTAEADNSSCLTCHNYHVATVGLNKKK